MTDDDPLADESDDGHGDHGDHEHHPHDGAEAGRVTSPMQEFSARQAAIGGVVTAVGLAVAFVLPYVPT